eukprot:TRINITY_DN1333_c0_g2_i3.p1 TRINITY_DN1333_c0_g2~~TRINITY_DN1333_c0_g2_i3.p1  ORF type:complete len:527 (+),score=74.76 TRINITY_DN1333_c0_g2_i3:246-1826(+)
MRGTRSRSNSATYSPIPDGGRKSMDQGRLAMGELDEVNPYYNPEKDHNGAHAPTKSLDDRVSLLRRATWHDWFPILSWIPDYNLAKLRGDGISGLSTGAMIIPQALAYSLLAGLPPTMGLYTGFWALLVYAALGQCGQLSIGPDAMTAILVRSFLAAFQTDEDMSGVDVIILANALAILVGIFLTILGFCRFGFIDNVLSKAVLRGFVTAVALIIMVEQLPPILAISVPRTVEKTYDKVWYIIEHLDETKLFNLLVGVLSVGFLLAVSYLKRFFWWMVYVPAIAILVVITMIFAYVAGLPNSSFPLLGHMGAHGFSLPHLPGIFSLTFHQISHLIDAAVVISIVGFVESVVVAKEYSAQHRYQVSSNRELIALGGANIVASFFRSYPTFGSLPRSGVANATGAKTPFSGIVTATVLGICIQFLIPVFEYMPRVTMAAIIFRASLLLIEEHEIIYMFQVRAWMDAGLMVLLFVLTFVLGIEKGIIIGLGISIFTVVKRTTLPRVNILGRTRRGKFRYFAIVYNRSKH